MTRLISKLEKDNKVIIISICLVIVMVVVGVIVALNAKTDEQSGISEGISAALTAGLVLFAGGSLFVTYNALEKAEEQKQIATAAIEISERQADIALNNQYNSVAPVLELELIKKNANGNVHVRFCNVGNGPAINVKCWIQDEEIEVLKFPTLSRAYYVGVMPTGKINSHIFVTGIEDYELKKGCIRAQYESIFGKVKTYESTLICPADSFPKLHYGLAKEIVSTI